MPGWTRPKAKKALEAVIKELMRFKKETVSPVELTKAKEMAKGSWRSGLKTAVM